MGAAYDALVQNLYFLAAGACDDGKKVPEMEIWYKNRIEKSYDACDEDYKVDFGKKIIMEA